MELTKICTPSLPTKVKSLDFTLYKGITFRSTFKFKDSDASPLSLQGIIVSFHIVDNSGKNILIINSSTTTLNNSGVIITDSTNGEADILITDEETSSLLFDSGYWWVTLTLSNGDIVLRGKGLIYLKEPYS